MKLAHLCKNIIGIGSEFVDQSKANQMKYWIKFAKAFNYVLLQGFVLLYIEREALQMGKPLRFNPLGLVFLTTQVNWMLFFYFVLGFITLTFTLPSLQKFLNSISGLMFTCGTYICVGYYGLVHHSEEVQSLIAKNPFVGHFMHWIHALPFLFVLIDLAILSSEGITLEWKSELKISSIYYVFYLSWSVLLFYINGRWPYPFQNKMNVFQTIIMDIILYIGLIIVTYFGVVYNKLCLNVFGSDKNTSSINKKKE